MSVMEGNRTNNFSLDIKYYEIIEFTDMDKQEIGEISNIEN